MLTARAESPGELAAVRAVHLAAFMALALSTNGLTGVSGLVRYEREFTAVTP